MNQIVNRRRVYDKPIDKDIIFEFTTGSSGFNRWEGTANLTINSKYRITYIVEEQVSQPFKLSLNDTKIIESWSTTASYIFVATTVTNNIKFEVTHYDNKKYHVTITITKTN